MQIIGNLKKYERLEFKFEQKVDYIKIFCPDGTTDTVNAFVYQSVDISYDIEGIENVNPCGKEEYRCRYTPCFEGDAVVKAYFASKEIDSKTVMIVPSDNHGYIEISKKDEKYFSYTDGTTFFSIGINLAFPTSYGKSDGTEFGQSGAYKFVGLRQYERWFKKCSENGVNVARIWLGHEYFCPDTEKAYEFDYAQFSKIDKLIELAKKYNIKLKLTLEQFRYFDYERNANSNSYSDDVFRKFNKRLYYGDRRCENANEWLMEPLWREIWLGKVNEFAKRYSGDTSIFAVELWNEMNCVGEYEKNRDVIEWNREMLPKVKEMFPKNLVINSLGSLDCDGADEFYNAFCWDKTDFVQIHRYLDQGARFAECNTDPIEAIKSAAERINTEKPLFIAETGAVNNCHSGPFKFYVNDDTGIIFADTVYTPLFVKCAGAGNIWHWDERYVEAKNLYHMYKPLAEMVKDIDFQNEGFESADMSDENVYALLLKGKSTVIGYIRNKSYNWQNVLRDIENAAEVKEFVLKGISARNVELYRIWDADATSVSVPESELRFENIGCGVMFKAKL